MNVLFYVRVLGELVNIGISIYMATKFKKPYKKYKKPFFNKNKRDK